MFLLVKGTVRQYIMNSPYAHPFLKRDNTMYLSTLKKEEFGQTKIFNRESSFLRNDIEGATPRKLIPKQEKIHNYSLSTFIEPRPNNAKSINKQSDPLFIDDIEGCRTKTKQFRTKRVVNPVCPHYILPSASVIAVDQGRNFIRDTLDTKDINYQRSHSAFFNTRKAQPVQGSHPSKLTKQLNAVPRLEVKDINKGQFFESSRRTDPLIPQYPWRDNSTRQLNHTYGNIPGTTPRRNHPLIVNKPENTCLDIRDIQGTKTNSFFTRKHFIDKRRQFRNYMNVGDIDKCVPSSLKKGIITSRQTNPLVPNYQYPGSKQIIN